MQLALGCPACPDGTCTCPPATSRRPASTPLLTHLPASSNNPFHPPSYSQVGDWLLFSAMGAYTLCGASKFNGIDATAPSTFYIASRH